MAPSPVRQGRKRNSRCRQRGKKLGPEAHSGEATGRTCSGSASSDFKREQGGPCRRKKIDQQRPGSLPLTIDVGINRCLRRSPSAETDSQRRSPASWLPSFYCLYLCATTPASLQALLRAGSPFSLGGEDRGTWRGTPQSHPTGKASQADTSAGPFFAARALVVPNSRHRGPLKL
jgi:hypothetical protein